MLGNILRSRRLVDGREVQEPTLLALGLNATGFLLLLAVLAAAVVVPARFALGWALFAAVAGLLAVLVLWPLLRRPRPVAAVTRRQRGLGRLRRIGRNVLAVALAGWLALIGWSQVAPAGPMPGPKVEPGSIRVLTWNILCGQDDGPPWEQHQWPARKAALAQALREAQPDILLVQEARSGQLAFLDESLPGYRRVGVGRDDGKSGGEHCAVY